MNPCKRVGLDVTWRCNWSCKTCFYLRNPQFHKAYDVPLEASMSQIDEAERGGLDQVVLVGYGEPSLCKNTPAILDYAHSRGMATSMITNGSTGLNRFQGYFDQGLDHLHISSHGLGSTLDAIAGSREAFAKQAELKEWMKVGGLPFRTNVTLQQTNYKELPELAEYECEMGVRHFVFLGFLPHYEWHNRVCEVAVHPATLRPYIEDAADVLLRHGVMFTIRYHPFCHLRRNLWPYVTNARYVAFDPGEWNYSLQATDRAALWRDSVATGESASIKSKPCSGCLAYRHCGGWNSICAKAFGGAGLKAVVDVPKEYQEVWGQDGGVFDLNPFNQASCILRSKE